MAKRTVLLVDDHPGWSGILSYFLRSTQRQEPHLVVQGQVGSKAEALAAVEEAPPDVLLLDVKLNDRCGLDLCQELSQRGLPTPVLVLTAYDEDAYLARAFAGGAVGYLLKTEDVRTIIDAIRRALQGEVLWTDYQWLRVRHWQQLAGDKWAALTRREQEVVAALVHFKTDVEIAEDLNISPNTVHQHLNRVFEKVGVTGRREVARWAIRYKLVER